MGTVLFAVNGNFELIGHICVPRTIMLTHESVLGIITNYDDQFHDLPRKVRRFGTDVNEQTIKARRHTQSCFSGEINFGTD